jgi:uncharacterized membrane protein YeiH
VGISDWRYITVAASAGLLVFYWGWISEPLTHVARIRDWSRIEDRWTRSVLIFDAAGLGLFAVTGTLKALAFHLAPVAAVLLGVMTGIGGGVLRDVLVSEVPAVLRAELYAVAALAGAIFVVTGRMLGFPSALVGPAGALLCFTLRFVAMRRGWRLPVARESGLR